MTSTTRLSLCVSLSKALVAVVLCYVLIVQSLTPHYHLMAQAADGLHEICANDPIAFEREDTPQKQSPAHDPVSTCCLIFGSAHLPRIASIISIVTYTVLSNAAPSKKLQFSTDFHLVQAPSLPRAPPHMG